MARLRLRKPSRWRDSAFQNSAPAVVILAGLGGLVGGYVGWALLTQRHRQALFHARPFRRLAALGYLRAHPSVDSARLLRDYLQWEPHPLLRRRARQVLLRIEQRLRW
ncbi:MAG: hypothetical protein H7Z40_08015 [Phycisphaerae bacterium]|nr:hypothetical protein [Gemmatimonadaceae bacterium]